MVSNTISTEHMKIVKVLTVLIFLNYTVPLVETINLVQAVFKI